MSKKGRKEIARLWKEKYRYRMPSEFEVAMMTEEQYANYIEHLKGILPKDKAEAIPEIVVCECKKPEEKYQKAIEKANEERNARMLEDYSPDDEDLLDLYQIPEIMSISIP